MRKSIRYLLYIMAIFVYYFILYYFNIENFLISIILAFVTGAISETLIAKYNKNKKKDITINNNEKDDPEVDEMIKRMNTKTCKYCKSKMNVDAIVCPTCRRRQSINNNPLLWIPISIIVLFFGWCIFSNNAPKPAKELLCGLGVRHGEYCEYKTGEYEIDIKFGNN